MSKETDRVLDLSVPLLAELRSEGSIEAHGAFDLDRDRAREKLRSFQLMSPYHYVLEFVQAAERLGARRVDIRLDADEMDMSFDGDPLTRDDLSNLYTAAFERTYDPRRRALRHLAIGMTSVEEISPRTVLIESSAQEETVRLEARGGEGVLTTSRDFLRDGVTRVYVRERTRLEHLEEFFSRRYAEEPILRDHLHYASMRVMLNREPISYGMTMPERRYDMMTRVRTEAEHAKIGLRYERGETHGAMCARVVILQHGVFVSEHTFPWKYGHVDVIVDSRRLTKNLSQSAFVEDEAWHQLMDQVIEEAICWLALERLRHGTKFARAHIRSWMKGVQTFAQMRAQERRDAGLMVHTFLAELGGYPPPSEDGTPLEPTPDSIAARLPDEKSSWAPQLAMLWERSISMHTSAGSATIEMGLGRTGLWIQQFRRTKHYELPTACPIPGLCVIVTPTFAVSHVLRLDRDLPWWAEVASRVLAELPVWILDLVEDPEQASLVRGYVLTLLQGGLVDAWSTWLDAEVTPPKGRTAEHVFELGAWADATPAQRLFLMRVAPHIDFPIDGERKSLNLVLADVRMGRLLGALPASLGVDAPGYVVLPDEEAEAWCALLSLELKSEAPPLEAPTVQLEAIAPEPIAAPTPEAVPPPVAEQSPPREQEPRAPLAPPPEDASPEAHVASWLTGMFSVLFWRQSIEHVRLEPGATRWARGELTLDANARALQGDLGHPVTRAWACHLGAQWIADRERIPDLERLDAYERLIDLLLEAFDA